MESALKEIEEYNKQRSILQKAANDLSKTNTIETSEFKRDIIEMVDMIDRKIKILKSEYSEDYNTEKK